MSFLHWTTKSLCRRGGFAFKCEKDTWCAPSIESFVRGDSWVLRTPVNFLNLLCKMITTVDQPLPQLWTALNNYFLHRPQPKDAFSVANYFYFCNWKVGGLAHEAVMLRRLCGYVLLTGNRNLPQALWAGVNWSVYFSCRGYRVWYTLTGANFTHITCILWVWLSAGLTTTQAEGVQFQCLSRETICHSRRDSQALCPIPLLTWSLKLGSSRRRRSHRDVCFFCESFQLGFMVRDSWRWLHGTFSRFWQTPADLWNLHRCQIVWKK